MFKHLIKVNQSYCSHLKDALKYSWHAQKASLYFLLHGLYPDAYETSGSTSIKELSEEIQLKNSGINKEKC
jgi:hypothetical protein